MQTRTNLETKITRTQTNTPDEVSNNSAKSGKIAESCRTRKIAVSASDDDLPGNGAKNLLAQIVSLQSATNL